MDGVRFSSYGFWDNFTSQFLSGDGRIEENVPAAKLNISRLLKMLNNPEILNEVGSSAKVSLAHVFEALKLQPNGPNGDEPDSKGKFLLVDGSATLFPIEGTGMVVYAYWYGNGWYLGANSVSSLGRWATDVQVVSRDSETVAV